MAIFRCKMCGGDLEIIEGSSTCTCEFCGTQQTLPTVSDEALQVLFNRANVLRMKSEFDKAAEVYEKILQKSDKEAEAYWGLILCKYGIEYVEDPVTYKRVPTCHRASFDAVTADEDYKNALAYADATQRRIYEAEAKAIDEIQKGIIALAQKSDPYDVFICYKETDESGNRTQDSVIANDIYHQLTQEGFKVFYAAITLEDKLGTEYEPYIFSALNTAKVMLALGTRPEYFTAVWVKNEWSRFLKLMKKDRSRLLIPCYRDMDAYELPEEFAHLQAQNMGKIGFMSDVVRGIKKVVVKESAKAPVSEPVVIQQSTAGTTAGAQIKRGNMALEDQDWDKADAFFEEALNLDPECAEAYLGKLFAREKKSGLASWLSMQKEKYRDYTIERLEACPTQIEHIVKKAAECAVVGYLDESTIKKEYEFDRGYNSTLSCRKSQKAKQLAELSSERLLTRAKQYAKGTTKKQIEDALAAITEILDQRIADAQATDETSIARVKDFYDARITVADKKAEELNANARNRQEQDYQTAVSAMKAASDAYAYENAKKALMALYGYKDSYALAKECQKEIDRIKDEEEHQKALLKEAKDREIKKQNKILAIMIAGALVCGVVALVLGMVIIPNNKYNAAVTLMNDSKYEEAIAVFEALDGYKESEAQIMECRYMIATRLMAGGKYQEAIEKFRALDGYKDSTAQIESCFIELLGWGQGNRKSIMDINIGDSLLFGTYEQDNDTTNGKEAIEWIVLAKEDKSVLLISKQAIDCRQYYTSNTSVTWDKCSLRPWLNDTFLNNAFTPFEQMVIATTNVSADKNPKRSTEPGKATTDKVFLLSIKEVAQYFSSDSERQCEPTEYAIANGGYVNGDSNSCSWWLRSPGANQRYAAFVSYLGTYNNDGFVVDSGKNCIRPALWISFNLTSTIEIP